MLARQRVEQVHLRRVDAARCYEQAQELERATELYVQTSHWDKAGTCQEKLKQWLKAAQMHANRGVHGVADLGRCCRERALFVEALTLLDAVRDGSGSEDLSEASISSLVTTVEPNKEKELCAEIIDGVVQDGATQYEASGKLVPMMICVERFRTHESQQTFLREHEHLLQLVELEQKLGRWSDAGVALIAMGQYAQAADAFEKAGQPTERARALIKYYRYRMIDPRTLLLRPPTDTERCALIKLGALLAQTVAETHPLRQEIALLHSDPGELLCLFEECVWKKSLSAATFSAALRILFGSHRKLPLLACEQVMKILHTYTETLAFALEAFQLDAGAINESMTHQALYLLGLREHAWKAGHCYIEENFYNKLWRFNKWPAAMTSRDKSFMRAECDLLVCAPMMVQFIRSLQHTIRQECFENAKAQVTARPSVRIALWHGKAAPARTMETGTAIARISEFFEQHGSPKLALKTQELLIGRLLPLACLQEDNELMSTRRDLSVTRTILTWLNSSQPNLQFDSYIMAHNLSCALGMDEHGRTEQLLHSLRGSRNRPWTFALSTLLSSTLFVIPTREEEKGPLLRDRITLWRAKENLSLRADALFAVIEATCAAVFKKKSPPKEVPFTSLPNMMSLIERLGADELILSSGAVSRGGTVYAPLSLLTETVANRHADSWPGRVLSLVSGVLSAPAQASEPAAANMPVHADGLGLSRHLLSHPQLLLEWSSRSEDHTLYQDPTGEECYHACAYRLLRLLLTFQANTTTVEHFNEMRQIMVATLKLRPSPFVTRAQGLNRISSPYAFKIQLAAVLGAFGDELAVVSFFESAPGHTRHLAETMFKRFIVATSDGKIVLNPEEHIPHSPPKLEVDEALESLTSLTTPTTTLQGNPGENIGAEAASGSQLPQANNKANDKNERNAVTIDYSKWDHLESSDDDNEKEVSEHAPPDPKELAAEHTAVVTADSTRSTSTNSAANKKRKGKRKGNGKRK